VEKRIIQPAALTPRWTPLQYVPEQVELWTSNARFRVVPAGRRSGKTELAKRFLITEALSHLDSKETVDGWYVFAAPTRDQAKRIYWEDLKNMIPRSLMMYKPRESDLSVVLWNGVKIQVLGMDVPERVEGPPLDGIVLDEYANMKPQLWGANIRPALDTLGRNGWAWFIGVPEGRNHYWDMYKSALKPENEEWDAFTWYSSVILPEEVIRQAKNDLDPLTYQQEYEASFVTFAGRAYYTFTEETHAVQNLPYYPTRPLILCFDFNKSPGTCAILQEQNYEGPREDVAKEITAAIGEVWIRKNSNTPQVCEEVIARWGNHKGPVYAYGDATGGITTTQSSRTSGSDWDQIESILGKHYGNRFWTDIPLKNPSERGRVNAMNSRLMSYDRKVHFLIDKIQCPHLIDDLESVGLKDDGSGKLDKEPGDPLTHISDGVGYYIVREFPIAETAASTVEVFGG
jgi:hypothetical protein